MYKLLQMMANNVQDSDLKGETWDTARLQEDFTVVSFAAPFVIVTRNADGKRGSLMFRHAPRIYFGWVEA